MRPLYCLLTTAAVAALPLTGAAQEDDSNNQNLRQRLKAQQEQIRKLEKRRQRSAELKEELNEQEQRLNELESNQFDTDSSTAGPEVNLSGYINAGFQSTNLSEDGPAYQQTDNEVRATNFTSAGLQVDAALTDRLSGTVQLLALGDEDFDARLEWGYLAYDITPAWEVRAGKLVAANYMHSQYFHVGYAYPWVEPPSTVYAQAPVRAIEGVDTTWRFNTGDIAHALNFNFGSTDLENNARLHNMAGANLSSTTGNIETWLSYRASDYENQIAPPLSALSADNAHTYFSSVGFEYDNGNWLFMAENTEVDIAKAWFPKAQSSYVTAGYRFGNWMPHITWARAEDEGFDETTPGPERNIYNAVKVHQKSWTFGVRGDIARNLTVKAEVSRYYDLGNSDDNNYPDRGLFNTNNPTNFQLRPGQVAALDDEDNPMVFRVSANLVF